MIVVQPGPLGEPAARLLAALPARGVTLWPDPLALPEGSEPVTLAVSDGPFVFDFLGTVRALGSRRFRVLVLSRLGAHPDARTASLQRLWRLEEHVRGGGAPTLTLRLAPLVGPETPFWRWLRGRPGLPRSGAKLVNPVHEADAVETLVRALSGAAAWEGWFEVAGSEAVSLAELRELAAATPGATGGQCEPSLDELDEHRLAECEPWASHFAITPATLASWTNVGAA